MDHILPDRGTLTRVSGKHVTHRYCPLSSYQGRSGVASPAAQLALMSLSSLVKPTNFYAPHRPPRPYAGAPRRKATTMMGNKSTTGPFMPLVIVVRNAVGEKEFNKLRGKGISLHSQGEWFLDSTIHSPDQATLWQCELQAV